jgi:2-C-methyl-D-erythritol 4-phosphate cytidylyltransferase
VRRGLDAVPDDCDIVVVHDGARPLASSELFESVIEAVLAGADAAIPGVSVTDTIKQIDDGCVVGTLDRDDLVAVQTPQAFRAAVLRRAHEGDPDATDDAALVESVGGTVMVVEGEATNLKITTRHDLGVARLHFG